MMTASRDCAEILGFVTPGMPLMRILLLILIYFVLCPIAGHLLGLGMVRAALAGQQPTLLVIYAVRIVAMLLAYLIVGPLLKALLVPRRAS
jgi:hypothetical protein